MLPNGPLTVTVAVRPDSAAIDTRAASNDSFAVTLVSLYWARISISDGASSTNAPKEFCTTVLSVIDSTPIEDSYLTSAVDVGVMDVNPATFTGGHNVFVACDASGNSVVVGGAPDTTVQGPAGYIKDMDVYAIGGSESAAG